MGKNMILLVEDNKNVQKFNKRMLERNNFDTEQAMTLAAARDFLAQRTPAAIILDVGMPDGNGLDFLRELRQTSQVPVLLLTGYRIDLTFLREFTTNRNDYLKKPYEFEVLLERLKILMQKAGMKT
ncbi:MAG: response regulator [Oscillospiraceae bacterium]|nr:response regulator [Oscillospiraceae bacterium]